MELLRIDSEAREFSRSYVSSAVRVSDVSKSLAGIVFIDDNSPSCRSQEGLYSAYIYLNPNYAAKEPLTIRRVEKYFRNKFEVQIQDFDDIKWENY